MVSKKGSYDGYMKPFFKDLVFEPMPTDRGGIAEIWSAIVNGLKGVIENDETKMVATQIPVHGEYKDPKIGIWDAAFGVIKNAWFDALQQKFESPSLAPAGKPQDQPKLDKPVPPRN